MKVTTDACLFGGHVSHQVKTISGNAKTILDIGTGTGLLTLMLAQQCNATIDVIETDRNAFEQAAENIALSPWAEQIRIFYGDAKEYSFPTQYDLIISNPPFYENELKSDDEKRNIALHNKGLLLTELLDIIKQNLKSEGKFYLLLPYKRINEIEKLIVQRRFAINHKVFVRQSINHNYFRIIIAGVHQQANKTETSTNEISIWNNKRQYTEEFIELLKDYYLHL